VESAPGQGSTFHFTASFGFAKASRPPLPLEETQLLGMRALVVDDNLTNRTANPGSPVVGFRVYNQLPRQRILPREVA